MIIYNMLTLLMAMAASMMLIRFASDNKEQSFANIFIGGACMGGSIWAVEYLILLCWPVMVPLLAAGALGISIVKSR